MTRLFGLSLLNAAIALLLLPCAAIAGGKATMITSTQTLQPGRSAPTGGHSETSTITWRDAKTVRLDMGDQAGYLLMRDGKTYSVDQSDGETQVMDMSAMQQMVQSMGQKSSKNNSNNPFGSIDSVEATGATDTVAGVEGRVYRMSYTEANGAHKSAEMVLTDDPLVVEMTRVYFGALSGMAGADTTHTFLDSLPGKDRGLLRMGTQLRVDSISRADPSASMFELPAKPMDMQSLMGGMGGR